MTDDPQLPPDEAAIDGAPTWLRILQAAGIGLVAGLALNALLSMVTLQGEGLAPTPTAPKECKKQAPAKDAVAPILDTPTLSGVTWTFEGLLAQR